MIKFKQTLIKNMVSAETPLHYPGEFKDGDDKSIKLRLSLLNRLKRQVDNELRKAHSALEAEELKRSGQLDIVSETAALGITDV